MKTFFGVFGCIVAFVLVVGLIIFGGWKAGWWFQSQNVDLQNQVNHHSQAYQDGLADRLRNDVQGWRSAAPGGQKMQIASTFCALYQDLTHPEDYPDLVHAQAQICAID